MLLLLLLMLQLLLDSQAQLQPHTPTLLLATASLKECTQPMAASLTAITVGASGGCVRMHRPDNPSAIVHPRNRDDHCTSAVQLRSNNSRHCKQQVAHVQQGLLTSSNIFCRTWRRAGQQPFALLAAAPYQKCRYCFRGRLQPFVWARCCTAECHVEGNACCWGTCVAVAVQLDQDGFLLRGRKAFLTARFGHTLSL
jgi:hypothetical protein